MLGLFGKVPQSNDTQGWQPLASGHGTYCDDLQCQCHYNTDYHTEITSIPQHDEETIRSAFDWLGKDVSNVWLR